MAVVDTFLLARGQPTIQCYCIELCDFCDFCCFMKHWPGLFYYSVGSYADNITETCRKGKTYKVAFVNSAT